MYIYSWCIYWDILGSYNPKDNSNRTSITPDIEHWAAILPSAKTIHWRVATNNKPAQNCVRVIVSKASDPSLSEKSANCITLLLLSRTWNKDKVQAIWGWFSPIHHRHGEVGPMILAHFSHLQCAENGIALHPPGNTVRHNSKSCCEIMRWKLYLWDLMTYDCTISYRYIV